MPARFIAAVDLGATNARVAIVNEDGAIEARRAGPISSNEPKAVLHGVGRTIDDLVRGVWVGATVAAIGVALPGLVDPRRGTVASVANMPGWDDVPIGELLGAPRGAPVAMENDANAAAVGEGWLGAAKGLRDYVFIALGTGIGAGIVIGGRLHRGAHALAGELAFFPMTRRHLQNPDWQHCLEADVSGRAMLSRARDLVGPDATTADLFQAAIAGDGDARAWLTVTQQEIAMAVADIGAMLDPEAIVFGGGVVGAQGESFLAPIRERAIPCIPGRPRIVQSALGDDAQLFGAARLALDLLDEAG